MESAWSISLIFVLALGFAACAPSGFSTRATNAEGRELSGMSDHGDLSAEASRPQPLDGKPAIHMIQGVHSKFGNYSGELEVRSRPDGHYDVIRVVTYETYTFDNFRVQEVWRGLGDMADGRLKASFMLKQADVFSEVDGEKRVPEQFRQKIEISYAAKESTNDVELVLPNGTALESFVLYERPPGPNPLWSGEDRRVLDSTGDSYRSFGSLIDRFLPLIEQYRNEPKIRASLDRPECSKKAQRFVFDPTDFDFLRYKPDTIRVSNKVLDLISMTESSLRRDAYGPTLLQKAESFDRDMQRYYLNDLGLFSAGIFDKDGTMTGNWDNGDGALWSGMYAGAQAMRYMVTGEAGALANFKRTVRGLMLLMDVTDDPATFARNAHTMKPGEVLTGNWRAGSGPYTGIAYLMEGNNDMYKGLVHAFAWAFEILPDGDPVLNEVKAHSLRLENLHVANERITSVNKYLALGLSALASESSSKTREFTWEYIHKVKPINLVGADIGYYYAGIADWSGVNLSMVGKITEILITKNVAKRLGGWSTTFGLDDEIVSTPRQAIMDMWGTYSTARRGFLTAAASTFGLANEPLGFEGGTQPGSWIHQERWNAEREDAKWLLREVPELRFKHRIVFDLRLRADWCYSWWPHSPWKAYDRDRDEPLEWFYQSAFNYPIFETNGLYSDQIWKDAFDYEGQAAINGRWGRADYLHMYWMSRLSGLIYSGD